ncbi:GATA transcription factor 11-like isoform X1 [Gossypium australe]|uniref:GATA transcription factor 11-like isoform X1 n=1 Tax=Gossypium australe TaxID=47621 RepID=A0A5B6UH72_9ROSI|nr:GATA transcription factor 11-like isoform X1 [Gossypium australe]
MSEENNIMNNSWFDKGFDGVNDDFFDDVIKYLDFPLEDVEGTDGGDGSSGEGVIDFHLPLDDDVEHNNSAGGEEWDCNFQNLEPPPANVLAGMSSGFSGDFFNDSSPKCLTCDGSSQLNRWSSVTEASSGRNVTLHSESTDVKGSIRFQTSSPVSVLESSSTCSAANPVLINPKLGFLVKRGRSKRRRASAFNVHFTLPFTSSSSSTSRGSNSSVGSESESESHLTEEPAKKRLKKKMNLTWLSDFSEMKKSPSRQPIEVRKCLHCEVTKTPQWREGPMGPKTLCNACGVRFRSGRLLPEYRPAASPTFVPALHSNSHKKVVEMRKQANLPTTGTPPMLSIPQAPISM